MGAFVIPATLDPTVAFIGKLSDPTLWHIVENVPIFKNHSFPWRNPDTKKVEIKYVVTEQDLYQIARNMNERERKGTPARMTIGHIKQWKDPKSPPTESENPAVIGYWCNAHVGTFGPDNEPCLLADAYVKADCIDQVKGRPYRSSEYYHPIRMLTGCGLFTSDTALDLGTVELYRDGEPEFYSMSGVFYMADEKEKEPKEEAKEEKLGEEQATEGEPEGHKEWLGQMEHYAKGDAGKWVGYAMHCYSENAGGPAMAGATNENIPTANAGEKEDEVMSRMQRDDQTINYARLESQMNKLAKQCEVYQQQIGRLTKERDEADCERMFRTLQAEHYQLKDSCEEFVKELLPLSADERTKRLAFIRKYVPRDMADGAMPLEVYQGNAETRPMPRNVEPTAKQVGELSRKHFGDPTGFDKAINELKNGQSVQN